MAEPTHRGVPLSTLCPKFLHTNSTSHTWPFSAIAELIDNAYDPDVSAKQFWIDKTVVKGQECLSFMDNGNGLDHTTMHKMLSFGYSDKKAVNGLQPIGIYGNGFKSGSMRLGKDAIVFSKSKNALCVGMLSQSYLEQIGANQIIVPIVCFEQREKNEISVRQEHKASLQDILRYSPFKTQKELLVEINAIGSSWEGKTGTSIIIWNLRRTSTGSMEFDFETDRYDIRIPSDVYEAMNDQTQQPGVKSYIPESVYSLRAYCSILYLKPRMQVIIRSQMVKSQLIAKSLAFIRKDHYKPLFLSKRITITFGYNTKSKDQYGVMMYHKNRLIKPYERVGCQLKADNKGVGVIGVIECNFLEPTHNKQSFSETDKYRKTIYNLGIKLEEYWQEIRHNRNKENPNSIPVEDTMKRPDQNWAQCHECMKWRKLPDGINCNKLPEKWYCHMNPNPQYRSCSVDEEREDSDDEQPSYQKTYKQQEREDRKKQENRRMKDEEDRKRQEEQRMADLTKKHKALMRQNKTLIKQLHQKPAHSPSTPTTPRSTFNAESPKVDADNNKSITVSQAACVPSSSSGLPVISDVCSLSTTTPRGKRTQPAMPPSTPKRPKVNGVHRGDSDTSTSVNVSDLSTPPAPVDNDSDDTDDDISILETASTPKPRKHAVDLTKIKTEPEPSYANSLLECSDDKGLETNMDEAGSALPVQSVGTSPSPAPPAKLANTTQTEGVEMKEEDLSQPIGERAGQSDKGLSPDKNVCVEGRAIKQESSGDAPGHNQGKKVAQKGTTHRSEDDAGPSREDASPLHYSSMIKVQQQQDQLVDLMQATAQERDSLKEQVHELTCQLNRLQELSQISVKKECVAQASQTDGVEPEAEYKSLLVKAKQKIDELIKEKEALLATSETMARAAEFEKKTNDELGLQADQLVRELEQSNKEKDDLRAQCEELRLSLQQQRENGEQGSSCLMELRHNIGRLLVSHVPALDLQQVNYECNVIDEILEQYLSNMGSDATPFGLRD